MEFRPLKPWIIRPRPNPKAALRLLCFPYAGAGASAFRTWPDALPASVEVFAIELPGRDTRAKERPLQQMSGLVTALADAIDPVLKAPFAIYGHSLGARIGFALARELRRRARPAPAQLFVSGHRAPQLPDPAPMSALSEAQLIARLRRLGGIPDAVLDDAELVAYFLPIIRADIGLLETEVYDDQPPLACPITAFGGVTDERATIEELDAWREQTSAEFEREMFPGGHFFIQTARSAVLGSLSQQLTRLTATL